MSNLLYLNASPRGEQSASTQAAQVYLDALPSSVEVTRLDLFDAQLPEFTPVLAEAKQQVTMGQSLSGEAQVQWQAITQLVTQFLAADHYLLAVPMWNFSVPYKLKQYIDLITHPNLTFTFGEKGMQGLATGNAVVVYSRGGDYSPKDGKPDPYDFQSPYLDAWLGMVGVGPISTVLVQRTMAGPNATAEAVTGAQEQLQSLARALSV
jgi:FMN-dependent NADH-azoreductase